jgi:hypothetical protein
MLISLRERVEWREFIRLANGEVVFTMSGQMDAESIIELETLISSEAKGGRIVLDLKA